MKIEVTHLFITHQPIPPFTLLPLPLTSNGPTDSLLPLPPTTDEHSAAVAAICTNMQISQPRTFPLKVRSSRPAKHFPLIILRNPSFNFSQKLNLAYGVKNRGLSWPLNWFWYRKEELIENNSWRQILIKSRNLDFCRKSTAWFNISGVLLHVSAFWAVFLTETRTSWRSLTFEVGSIASVTVCSPSASSLGVESAEAASA